ncbi:MAG: Vi polysaccharide export inner rane protein VexD [Enterovirga sp.]|jgi:capsular polysaccharide transport system permease protein|nr:Vi polysaccharide export inner rane protein VexD [Enterovirga sp.]
MQNEIAITPPGKRDIALERSQRMSRALADAARKARLTVRSSGGWSAGASRGGRAARSFALWSAILVFILPTLGGALYYGVLASDQYQVETQFAVRARQIEPTDILGKLTGVPSLQQAQDALVVVDYIYSRSIVEKLDEMLNLRAMYARPEVSWLDEFDPSKPIERLTKYWRKMIHVDVSTVGIISVHVRAYRAEDAQKIGEAVIQLSEKLVNDMSVRSRQDAVVKAQRDVRAAEERLIELRDELRRVRNREGVIDPKKAAEQMLLVLTQARAQRIKIEDEIKVGMRTLSASAPQMQIMNARLNAITSQIAALESEMTAREGSPGGGLAQAFTSYDKAMLDQVSAEKLYTVISASLEKARMDANRQQVFLETFVEPVLPQEPEFPRRSWNTFLVALGTFVGWFLLNYARSAIKGI